MKSTTVRFTLEESFANDQLALDLGRECGRKLDLSEIDRALWRLGRQNPAVRDLLLEVLRAGD